FNKEPHRRGTVSMARAQSPDSGDSQFFICFADAPFLDGKYTVWGQVTEGMTNVDRSSAASRLSTPTGSSPPRWPRTSDRVSRLRLSYDQYAVRDRGRRQTIKVTSCSARAVRPRIPTHLSRTIHARFGRSGSGPARRTPASTRTPSDL